MDAEMTVRFMAFETSYTSNVTCKPHQYVQVSYHFFWVSVKFTTAKGRRFVIESHIQEPDHYLALSTSFVTLALCKQRYPSFNPAEAFPFTR